ncbi:MAG: hypothetical protein AVDCRST_MAG40-324, partial [uncultured Gemmatimonadaceae bacterium]
GVRGGCGRRYAHRARLRLLRRAPRPRPDHRRHRGHPARARAHGHPLPDVLRGGRRGALGADSRPAGRAGAERAPRRGAGALRAAGGDLRGLRPGAAALVVALPHPSRPRPSRGGREPRRGGRSRHPGRPHPRRRPRHRRRARRRRRGHAGARPGRHLRRRDDRRPRVHRDRDRRAGALASGWGGRRRAALRRGQRATVRLPVDGLGAPRAALPRPPLPPHPRAPRRLGAPQRRPRLARRAHPTRVM